MKKNKKFDYIGLQPGTKSHEWGECLVLISPPFNGRGYHMSISHKLRYPTWDEIRDAWYALVPNSNNRIGAMILPNKKDYINVHPNCFQVHELKDF
jgi:hypothetical protein